MEDWGWKMFDRLISSFVKMSKFDRERVMVILKEGFLEGNGWKFLVFSVFEEIIFLRKVIVMII